MRADSPTIDTGTLDARYELGDVVGSGATAVVYHAVDRELGRPVAVKIFGPASELSDSARRRHEARALAALRHPSIVTIFDARLDHEPPYLVLEYVPGVTLAGAIAHGPMSRERAWSIAAAAAAGLACAHDAGIVHRDVKPANILLPADDADSAARLLDFGIAHSYADPGRTAAGTVLGSASYLSPEQARGEQVGPASDVYSLGLVLIECLTGRPAFPGSTPEAVAARLLRGPDLTDPALEADAALLAAMTDRDPAARPSASAVAESLRGPTSTRVLQPTAAATVGTRRLDAPASTSRRLRRRTVSRAAIGAGLLAGVAVVGAIAFGLLGPSVSPQAEEKSRLPVVEEAPTTSVEAPAAPTTPENPGNNGNSGTGNGNDGNGNSNGNGRGNGRGN